VNTLVDKGYAVAIKKLGVIGVQVRLIPPGAQLPDHFEVTAEVTKKQRNMAHITKISSEYEEDDLDLEAIVNEPEDFMEEE
jgi:small subunit ribosomal protein S3